MNFKRFHESKNILPSADSESKSSGNIVVECDGNGRYHVYGTTSNITITIYFDIPSFVIPVSVGNGGNGTFSIFNTYTGATNTGLVFYNGSTLIDSWALNSLNRTSTTYSAMGGKTITKLGISVAPNQTVDGYMSPMFTNDGQLPSEFEPYSSEVWHDIPHYIHNTSTDTLTTLPADIYANDTTATVGLKGNMEQSSTPSPQTPIQPSECGDLSENLYDTSSPNIYKGYYNTTTNSLTGNPNNAFIYIPLVQGRKYYVYGCKRYNTSASIRWVTTSSTPFSNVSCIRTGTFAQTDIFTITAEANENYLALFLCGDSDYSTYGTVEDAIATNGANLVIDNGIKIPISSASTTTPVYLGEVESTRQIKKLVFTGQESFGEYTNPQIPRIGVYTQLSDMKTNMRNSGYSSHFTPIVSPSQNAVNGITFGASNDYLYITFSLDTAAALNLTDMNSIKQWFADQYAAGTPVTVWYVLATPTTGIVNEPLRKIGDYADEVSGITIPTTAGANTLSVGTTLQPSEVTVNYKGWHPVSAVHERENGAWD